MKKNCIFPALAVGGGFIAFLLRLAQNRTGFDILSGLPLGGNVWGTLLPILLAAMTLAALLLAQHLPKEEKAPLFTAVFRSPNTGAITLLVAGMGLLLLSGALELLRCLLYSSGTAFSSLLMGNPLLAPKASILLGALGLASAACLFPVIRTCRRRPRLRAPALQSTLLLPMPVYLVVRLVFLYRVESMSPVLEAYYVQLLALALLTMAFYSLAGFAHSAGRTTVFLSWTVPAIAAAMAALADAPGLPAACLFAGGALTLLGFLLLRMETLSKV